jgi:glycosyltransferase involved in cell wall biosynthesis
MIVKNEARNLPLCFDSMRGLASELVVVDTGSTDASSTIAAGYGARVLPFDFTHVDFAAARNYAISLAAGRWILMLDADERLHAESAPLLQHIVAGDENAGHYFERRSPDLTDYVVRLFPNRPDYRFRGRVHETIDASILQSGGELRRPGIRIHHDFAPDPEERRRKNQWYIGILLEEIAANPADDTRLDFLAAEYHQLGMIREAAEIAERIALMRPRDHRAHLFAGIYRLIYPPDLTRARAYLRRALALKPGYAEALSFLALAELEAANV